MKRLMTIVLVLAGILLLTACSAKAPPTQEEVLSYLQQEADVQLAYYREATGLDDLTVRLALIDYAAEPTRGSSRGYVRFCVEETLYSDTLLRTMEDGALTPEMVEALAQISFGYEDLTCEGYPLRGESFRAEPLFVDEAGNEYTFDGDCVYQNGDLYDAATSGTAEETVFVPPDKPYVGMSGDLIDLTGLGPHDDVGYNYRKITVNSATTKHRCTLYYWMDGSRCIFIARVQDDLNEVILVDENPSGSYFGN